MAPIGILVGIVLTVRVLSVCLRRLESTRANYVGIAAIIGGTAAPIPGVFLGVVVGGNLGGALAAQLSEGLLPFGITAGIAIVFFSTVAVGFSVAALLGICYEALNKSQDAT